MILAHMSKLKKGYFVRGQFVAEGSALDQEFKRELKGTDEQSRTERKHESSALQALGVEMLDLRSEFLTRLALPDKLVDALAEARRITNFEGRRRQIQFIGKQMRLLDAQTLDAIRGALAAQHAPSAQETLLLHQVEDWRVRLLADDSAMDQWMQCSPATDAQQLRALIRQARKDAKPEKPGQAPRHGRAYRDIFQLVREQLLRADATPDAGSAPDFLPPNPGADV